MRFPVYGDGRFLVRRLDEAKDFACAFVKPVLLIIHAILLPHFEVARVRAGLSGPAIFPIALLAVWEIVRAVRIPVIAVGGIAGPREALKFFMAGATAVQLGTVLYSRPELLAEVRAGVRDFVLQRGLEHPHALRIAAALPSPSSGGLADALGD